MHEGVLVCHVEAYAAAGAYSHRVVYLVEAVEYMVDFRLGNTYAAVAYGNLQRALLALAGGSQACGYCYGIAGFSEFECVRQQVVEHYPYLGDIEVHVQ